jgi:hypothetical protein
LHERPAAFGDADPDDVKTLKPRVRELEQQLAAAQATAAQATTQADEAIFSAAIERTLATHGGVFDPDVVDLVVAKARKSFTITNGTVTAQPDVFSAADPGQRSASTSGSNRPRARVRLF